MNGPAPIHERIDSERTDLLEAEARLRSVVRTLGSTAVAFSGGVDSSLVLKVCVDELKERAIAVIGVSPSLPPGELERARSTAREIGAEIVELDTRELEDPDYLKNPENRCYFCKKELYRVVMPFAHARGIRTVVDGFHLDDLGDWRPGRRASDEEGVRHPLLEAGLSKDQIRALSRKLGLAHWNKASLACLSSRIPYGTPVTLERLDQVAKAEASLNAIGLETVRVRHHGAIARIEVSLESLDLVLARRSEIVEAVRAAGFEHVTLDLMGYRQGSLNRPVRHPR